MEQNNARIHLKVGEIALSIEGAPDYVNKQYNQMAKDLNLQEKLGISSEQEGKPKTKKVSQTPKSKTSTSKEELKEKAEDWIGENLYPACFGSKQRWATWGTTPHNPPGDSAKYPGNCLNSEL